MKSAGPSNANEALPEQRWVKDESWSKTVEGMVSKTGRVVPKSVSRYKREEHIRGKRKE